MASKCQLCNEIFSLRKKLVIHERIKHQNNKTIPHHYLLNQPPLEQIIFYQDAFIVLIKNHLGFNRHSIGTKQVSINAFSENIFVYIFENEPSFRYSEAGEHRLKQLVNYDYWNVWQDPKLKTKDNNALAIEFSQTLEWLKRLCDNIFIVIVNNYNKPQDNFTIEIDNFCHAE
ncbi:20534_t:CDS:2, partial [Gigaspora rosea]